MLYIRSGGTVERKNQLYNKIQNNHYGDFETGESFPFILLLNSEEIILSSYGYGVKRIFVSIHSSGRGYKVALM